MDNVKFCEELYSSYGDVIEPHRKSLVLPLVVLTVGIVLLSGIGMIEHESLLGDIKPTFVMSGIVVTGIGLAMLAMRLLGKGAPWHKPSHTFLREQRLSYEAPFRRQVLQAIVDRDVKALRSIPTQTVAAVSVLIYSTANDSFVAMQAFEYVELEFRPLTDIMVITK